ncbi:hypothetical protein D0Y65_013508 [Glycine soja]|uniref:Uncharacterized protein n=1 Tax=Glycine soja TaxID=3848 RepID=A0A445K3I3_GLYSO|nr:hypothetical protein D0Y65_013508 [Glycine soja]
MKVDRLLVDYLEASLEARHCCDTILQAIHQTRFAYARVTNVVVKLSQTTSYDDDQSQNPIHTQLSSFIHDPLTYAIIKEKENSKNINYKACLQEGRDLSGVSIRERFNTTTNSCMKLCEQLDVAAKRVYVVINELDTMSRTIKRLDDEVEHWREIADICVKNYCKCEILKRIVKEFQDNKSN